MRVMNSYSDVRGGFTLTEVLIATVILALGLVGIGAIFPAVISQQRSAVDLSTAIGAGANGEAILASRLSRFAASIETAGVNADDGWLRVNAFDPKRGDEEPYLRSPSEPKDVRLQVQERDYEAAANTLGTIPQFHLILPRRPLLFGYERAVVVKVKTRSFSGGDSFELILDRSQGFGQFMVIGGAGEGRLVPGQPNDVDLGSSKLDFHFQLLGGETIESVKIDYIWLNDRIISHRDRLYPADDPNYGWEMAFRRTGMGQVQYCLFIYKFTGPSQHEFYPDIPPSDREGDEGRGMLRGGRATVRFDQRASLFYLTASGNTDLDRSLERGAWLLPKLGASPVKVRRFVEGEGWELDAPPMDSQSRPMIGLHEFWYMPLEIQVKDNQGLPITWRIRPLLAYTKELGR